MKSFSVYGLLIYILILSSSCQFQDKQNPVTSKILGAHEMITDTLLSKTISFPKSLYKLDGDQFQKIDLIRHELGDREKIVSIIDGTCMKCIIGQLNVIDSTFNNILDDNELMVFILNVKKADSAYFMNNLRPAIKAKGLILWDNDYNFEKENNLFTIDDNLRTFMVSKNNRIVHYGSPLYSSKVIPQYKAKLEDEIL